MIPELFSIGPITINSFGVMAMLGFLVPTLLMRKEFERIQFDPEMANGIAISAMIGGFLGGRTYYIIENWSRFIADPIDMIFTGAGLVWYGGFIGGVIGVSYYIKKQNKSILQVADLVAPFLALGQAFGRIGCLLSGDGDYGPPTDLPWAMSFPNGVVPTNAMVHPTPIYDSLILTTIFLILWRIRLSPAGKGVQLGRYLILAGVGRIFTEFFRRTPRYLFDVSGAQWISIVLIITGVILISKARKNTTEV